MEDVPEVEYNNWIASPIPYILSFLSTQLLAKLWQFQNLTYFCTSWSSYLTSDPQNLQGDAWY